MRAAKRDNCPPVLKSASPLTNYTKTTAARNML